MPHGLVSHGVLRNGVLPHGFLPHGVIPHGVKTWGYPLILGDTPAPAGGVSVKTYHAHKTLIYIYIYTFGDVVKVKEELVNAY